MIIDFKLLSNAVKKHVIKVLDHNDLNTVKGLEIPTAENVAKWTWKRLKKICANQLRVKLREVIVWETESAKVTYYGK